MSSKNNILLLFPNHLFEDNIIKKKIKEVDINNIILIEHPLYYGFHINKNSFKQYYNFNKLKIIYQIATFNYYVDYLKSKLKLFKDIKIKIITLDYLLKNNKENKYNINKTDNIYYFNTLNKELNSSLYNLYENIIMYDTPNLLTPIKDLESYYNKHKNKRQSHATFHKWQKPKYSVAYNKTYDIQSKLPNNVEIPKLPPLSKKDTDYLRKATNLFKSKYSSLFNNLTGNDNYNNIIFPVTHKTSIEYMQFFIKHKFPDFAKYQDSIIETTDKKKLLLFHSGLSPMLNNGLLLPEFIMNYFKTKKGILTKETEPIFENFSRQLFGWREYQYYIYYFYSDKLESLNYFDNNNNISKKWYDATTTIKPLDDCITQAFKYGYLHHILRLMIVCNAMNLYMIKPSDVFKWFMEFSLDSYEWVMYCNVYSMGLWSDGGIAMRKPYLASDNYILKMSNYKKGDWNNKWNSLFYNFINTKQKYIKKTYYAGMIKHWNNKSSDIKQNIIDTANSLVR